MTAAAVAHEVRVGIDVGGTFTDGVLVRDGAVTTAKVLSRPIDVAGAILECCDKLGVDLGAVDLLIHGTTIATNAIIEQTAPAIAHITTAGYRDVLHIRRGDSAAYDLKWQPPKPVVRRRDIYEVDERLAWDGAVVRAFDDAGARKVARIIAEMGYRSVSVVFLHSYVDSTHERRMREILLEECPDITVSISAEVLPHYREFERSSTTAVNAYLKPLMAGYLSDLVHRAGQRGLRRAPLIMQSNGGVMTVEEASRLPARTARSGPAGGTIAATTLAEEMGLPDAILIDMGGTSTEVAVRRAGQLRWSPQLEFAWGTPIRFPSVEIHSIGAGGGSIARVEGGQFLKVGPESAGAQPGPACYAGGGLEPTTTDAQVLLGRLNPDGLLDGAMPIDVDLAEQAIATHIAAPLGLTVEQAALGILQVTTSNMMQAIRLMTVNRGVDPAECALVAYGGSGPLYAAQVAATLGIRQVVIPAFSGVTSALGMVLADFEYDESLTLLKAASQVEPAELSAAFAGLERSLLARLGAAGVDPGQRAITRYVDVRYEGQGYELPIAAPFDAHASDDDGRQISALQMAFHEEHAREFGWRQDDWPLEFVFVRASAHGVISGKPRLVAPDGASTKQPTMTRPCHFAGYREPLQTSVIRRSSLSPGTEVDGPAIVEQMDATTLVPPGCRARVAATGSLVLERLDSGRGVS